MEDVFNPNLTGHGPTVGSFAWTNILLFPTEDSTLQTWLRVDWVP